MKKLGIGAAVLVGILALSACSTGPEALRRWCEKTDMVYVYDDPNNGSELFVIHNHEECR